MHWVSKSVNKRMFVEGRPLTVQERTIFKPFFAKIVLERVRIIDGRVPFWLRRNMCAIVLGESVYFRAGMYQPNITHQARGQRASASTERAG